VDKVVDIQEISHDRKRKVVMKRTTKKRRLTLEITLLITTNEILLNTQIAKTTELIKARMAITYATLEREKRDEKELTTSKKELYHLHSLAKYYKDSTQEVVFLRIEFRETYAQFTSERNIFTTCIANFQEDTLMGWKLVKTCRDGMKRHIRS
jgi:hypothetical protein